MNQTAHSSTFLGRLAYRTRHLRNRPRLSFSALIFVVVLSASSYYLHLARSLLLAFDIAAATFLVLTAYMIASATPASMRRRAKMQMEARWIVLVSCMMVSLVTVVALALELHSGRSGSPLQVILSGATIVLSWCFFNTMFTLHYAHDYYAADNATAAGLEFPGTATPDYWDFMYFAFVIGMTFQVSDVQITSCALRRVALAHSFVAFFFNVVIIALTVNIVASLG